LSEDNGTLSQHLFDSNTPPPEIQHFIDAYKRNEPLSRREEEIYSLLCTRLEKQEDTLEIYRKALYREYLSGFHEQEAWVIGRSLDARAQQYNLPGKSANSTVYGATLPHAVSDSTGRDSGFASMKMTDLPEVAQAPACKRSVAAVQTELD